MLWRKVKPALSAGRVQSVAVRLIVEREREIQAFKSEPYFRVSAIFGVEAPDGSMSELKAELDKRFSTHDEVKAFLEKCKTAGFTVSAITKKPLKRTPAPRSPRQPCSRRQPQAGLHRVADHDGGAASV